MEKLFWGATEIAEYANVSRSSAINFMKRMRIMYDIDPQRCLYGKIPVAVVKDFFNQEVKKRNQLVATISSHVNLEQFTP